MAKPLHVYVAGSSQELPRVREAMRRLRAEGHHITFDWTTDVEQFGTHGDALTIQQRQECADRDFYGIAAADVFLMLDPAETSRGVQVELGFAISRRWARHHVEPGTVLAIVIAGPGQRPTIWHACADHVAANDEDAIAWLATREER